METRWDFWRPPERKRWNAWMIKEWTKGRCAQFAVQGTLFILLGIFHATLTFDRLIESWSIKLFFDLLGSFALMAIGALTIRAANKHWKQLQLPNKQKYIVDTKCADDIF